MPRPCHPFCNEKRDFMEVNPPRKEEDFYRDYDPMIGIGTVIVLCVFFLLVTVKSCVRHFIRRWQMYKFYKQYEKNNDQSTAPEPPDPPEAVVTT